MTVVKGFVITITSGVVFAVLGAGCGTLLGAVSPDYDRTVFHVPPGIQLNATAIGFGLGVTQGLAGGDAGRTPGDGAQDGDQRGP